MPATSVATSSRAVVVIGMHRSGTSAVARGLAALGVDLGDDFLDAQPENPTGYWEDRVIVELDERVLRALGLRWDDAGPIDAQRFSGWRMWRLRRETTRYLRRCFVSRPLWGFKDPRTIRILPFWVKVLQESRVGDSYLLAIRNPMSVAASLYARQKMDLETAQRLWLVYTVPFLRCIEQRPLVVVDYDLLVQDPRYQLERMRRRLELPKGDAFEVEHFVCHFLDAELRHTTFSAKQIDASGSAGRLTRDAFRLLHELASDNLTNANFWNAWGDIERSFDSVASRLRSG